MTSLANQIRDAIYDRVVKANAWKSTRKAPQPTLTPEACPGVGVFLLRETKNPDGDANTGPPKFVANAVISIAVVDVSSKPTVMEGSIDTLIDQIEDLLLTDYTLLGITDTVSGLPIIEAVTQITRIYQFPQTGETYFMECRLQITFEYRCVFPPKTPVALETISIAAEPFENTATAGGATMTIDIGSLPQ